MTETIKQQLAREVIVATARAFLGTPYIWGGDDPQGIDCSGLAIECLKSAGVLPNGFDATADQLMKMFASNPVVVPGPGDLAFYLDSTGKAYHVVVCVNQYYAIGANGGMSKDTTIEQAMKDDAYVKYRPIQQQMKFFASPVANLL